MSLGSSVASEGICLFVVLWEAQLCLGDSEWDSCYLNYPVRDDDSILTWLDFSLTFSIMPQVRAEACISLQASWEQVFSSNCPNYVRRTKSSIKKRIIVRRTVRSMFGEQTFSQLRTGFTISL